MSFAGKALLEDAAKFRVDLARSIKTCTVHSEDGGAFLPVYGELNATPPVNMHVDAASSYGAPICQSVCLSASLHQACMLLLCWLCRLILWCAVACGLLCSELPFPLRANVDGGVNPAEGRDGLLAAPPQCKGWALGWTIEIRGSFRRHANCGAVETSFGAIF